MNGFTQQPQRGANGSSHQQRHSIAGIPEGRMQGEPDGGAMPLPVGAASQRMGPIGGGGMAARSPPKNKNTAHVPCKFFLQGQCQAGRTCPFSHNIDSTTHPTPCKYFSKGGCKFGRKCALLHILPDGTIVNRMPPQPYPPPQQAYMPGGQVQVPPGAYGQPPPGLLSMQAQALEARQNGEDFVDNYHYGGPRNGQDLPQIDMTYTSASPQYGSPPQNERFAASPPQKGLSVLDAPLPNSFDSNGISMAARNGPFASSVPSRFGLESPPSSLPQKLYLGNTALRDLHNSAFGNQGMDGMLASMGSSPPSGTDEPLTFSKRPLHSERLRQSRGFGMVSASLGTRLPTQSFEYSDDEDDSGEADREEDLLPASLHELISEGGSRRGSRHRVEEESGPAAFLAAQRRTISGHGTAQDNKVSSSYSSSPSRYIGMFSRVQPGKQEHDTFGHVGSPLRNSGFAYPPLTTRTTSNGDLSPSVSSPPRQASMSMLTQELQRTKLDAARSQASGGTQAPMPIRTLSNGSARMSLDRGASSTSVTKIDEEQELFDMDDEVGAAAPAIPRSSGGPPPTSRGAWDHKLTFGASSPSSNDGGFGAIGAHRNSLTK